MMSENAEPLFIRDIETPLGTMVAGATSSHVVLLEFADRPLSAGEIGRLEARLQCTHTPGESPVLARLEAQLREYFAGQRREFDIDMRAPGTDFQERVWDALREIPCGETRSYGEVAATIGQPSASRAVAAANHDNRIAILIPCHRVIGANGTLTGYGGGLWRKERLLELEAGVERLL